MATEFRWRGPPADASLGMPTPFEVSDIKDERKDRKKVSRVRGVVSALICGFLAAVGALLARVAFDFTPRLLEELGKEDSSITTLHRVSDRIVNVTASHLSDTMKTIASSPVTVLRRLDTAQLVGHKISSVACTGMPSIATCTGDHSTRAIFLGFYLLVGVAVLRLYLDSLRLLPSAVEATAAVFASNFLLSGIFGALFFAEWAERSDFGICLWVIGAALMVIGVFVIGTDTTAKVGAKKAVGKTHNL